MKRSPHEQEALPLGEAIRKQLDSDQLGSDQLQQLMAMQQAVLGDPDTQPQRDRRRFVIQALAACALLLGVAGLWQNLAPSNPDLVQEIAYEVVHNHLKLKPLDTAAQSIAEARDFFTQLDFSPVNSTVLERRFALPERSLLGGRYCSIQGVTAAQLRYQQGGDGLSTLYQVAYAEEIFGPVPSIDQGQAPGEILVKGLRVSLWVEKGLLMVLVRD